MVMKRPPEAGDVLQGTLDMLILRTLVLGVKGGVMGDQSDGGKGSH